MTPPDARRLEDVLQRLPDHNEPAADGLSEQFRILAVHDWDSESLRAIALQRILDDAEAILSTYEEV